MTGRLPSLGGPGGGGPPGAGGPGAGGGPGGGNGPGSGGAGGPGGPLAAARAQLDRYKGRLAGNGPDQLSWQEKGARLWNATSVFSANRSLVSSQDELNSLASRADSKARQWAQVAEQKLNAGDLAGFNNAIRKSRQYDIAANRMRGNAASVMADAADQAMGEAADIRQISFETASAIGNPTGYVAGKATGYVVQKGADLVLPDGRVKQVVVAVSSAAASAYAGGMTPQAWQNLGAAGTATNALGTGLNVTAESASYAVGIADTVTSVTTTYSTKGGEEAAWEIATNLITHAVMNTKSTRLGDAEGNPRSLNDYLATAPSAAAVREAVENNLVPVGQIEVSGQNLRTLANNSLNRALGNVKRDPYSVRPLDADPALIQTLNEMPSPPISDADFEAAASMGQTPEMVTAKAKLAQLTGGTFFERGASLESTQMIQRGEARGKGIEQHQKSAGDAAPFLPMDTMESKLGPQLRDAQAAWDANPNPETARNLTRAQENVAKNRHAIEESIANGSVMAGPPPPGDTRIQGQIARDPATGLPIVQDIDPVTNNLSRPGEPARNGGSFGIGTTSELQHVSNVKAALEPYNLDSSANHGNGSRNPSQNEPLPDRVIRYTPDGRVEVIEGQVNVLNAIRESGSPEHPTWEAQAQEAVRNNPDGPQLAARSTDAPDLRSQVSTEAQARLANNRNTLRSQYVRGLQNWQGLYNPERDPKLTPPRRQSFSRPPSADAAIVPVGYRSLMVPRPAGLAGAGPPAVAPEPIELSREADLRTNDGWGRSFNAVLDRYNAVVGQDDQILVRLKAFDEIRTYVLTEFDEKERVDRYVRWAYGLDQGDEPDLPVTNQSTVYERVDAQALPAWRGDLDGGFDPGVHVGLVQYYTQQVVTLAGQRPYAWFPEQTTIAQELIDAVGEEFVRAAFFQGDTWKLYGRIGWLLGAKGDGVHLAGYRFIRELDEAAVARDVDGARKLIEDLRKTLGFQPIRLGRPTQPDGPSRLAIVRRMEQAL